MLLIQVIASNCSKQLFWCYSFKITCGMNLSKQIADSALCL